MSADLPNTYIRVIPRDLFNEGNFLVATGRLDVALENYIGANLVLREHDGGNYPIIDQDPSDGSIFYRNLHLDLFCSVYLTLFRPLNTKNKYSLYGAIQLDGSASNFDIDETTTILLLDPETGKISEELQSLIDRLLRSMKK